MLVFLKICLKTNEASHQRIYSGVSLLRIESGGETILLIRLVSWVVASFIYWLAKVSKKVSRSGYRVLKNEEIVFWVDDRLSLKEVPAILQRIWNYAKQKTAQKQNEKRKSFWNTCHWQNKRRERNTFCSRIVCPC